LPRSPAVGAGARRPNVKDVAWPPRRQSPGEGSAHRPSRDHQSETWLPIWSLGHQLLALSLGGRTLKMSRGHRGANHPVKDLRTGKVEITSQNHGFAVAAQDRGELLEAAAPGTRDTQR